MAFYPLPAQSVMAEDKVTQVNLKNYKTQIVVRKKKTTNYYLQSL